jgi:class 3 adenylate cyclase
MEDLETLSMTAIIRLQDQLSQVLKRRFEKNLALAFSDIVDSTRYFQQFGNEAGRGMQQRHYDLLQRVVGAHHGRIVDTAGDGAFTCFPHVVDAAHALIQLEKLLSDDNMQRQREHQLRLRIGIHYGPVLTDGIQVTGDAVNVCARVASSAAAGEIRITGDAFRELTDVHLRVSCKPVPTVELKGVARTIEMMVLQWRDSELFPASVIIQETGQEIALPDQDIITFGRLSHTDAGVSANDISLQHPDPLVVKQISRWHFELRRRSNGFVLRPVSDQVTEVNDAIILKGHEAPIRPGTVVRLGKALTLRFESPSPFDSISSRTQIFK